MPYVEIPIKPESHPQSPLDAIIEHTEHKEEEDHLYKQGYELGQQIAHQVLAQAGYRRSAVKARTQAIRESGYDIARIILGVILLGFFIWFVYGLTANDSPATVAQPAALPNNAADTGKEKGNRQKREAGGHKVDTRRTRNTERSQNETDQGSNQKD